MVVPIEAVGGGRSAWAPMGCGASTEGAVVAASKSKRGAGDMSNERPQSNYSDPGAEMLSSLTGSFRGEEFPGVRGDATKLALGRNGSGHAASFSGSAGHFQNEDSNSSYGWMSAIVEGRSAPAPPCRSGCAMPVPRGAESTPCRAKCQPQEPN